MIDLSGAKPLGIADKTRPTPMLRTGATPSPVMPGSVYTPKRATEVVKQAQQPQPTQQPKGKYFDSLTLQEEQKLADEISKQYPEMTPQEKSTKFYELGGVIQSKRKTPVQPKTFMQKAGDWAVKQPKNIVGGALETAKGIPKIGAELLKKPITYATSKLSGLPREQVNKIYNEEILDPTMGDKESIAYQGTKFLGDIGQSATGVSILGKAGAKEAAKRLPQATKVVKEGLKTLPGKVLGGAGLGLAEQTAYSAVADQRAPTKEEAMLSAGVGGAFPLLGAGLSKGKEIIKKASGKKAEELAIKGTLNVSDARKVMQQLAETGDDDVGSIGRRALEKKVVGGDEKSIIKKLQDISSEGYTEVRKQVADSSQKLGALGKSETVNKAMTLVGKQMDTLNTRAGYDAFDLLEVQSIQKAAKDGSITLAQKQRAKELIDEFVSVYKKSGDVADTQLGKIGDPLRKAIREEVEDGVTKATNGKVNIKEMNRDVQVAKTMEKAIQKKEVANELKQYALQGGLGGTAGLLSGGGLDPSNPETYIRFIAGAFLGRQTGKLLASPAFNSKIAIMLDKLSGGTRKALLEYAKAPKVVKLTEGQLEEILSVKEDLLNIVQ